jgi:hypothetical protein
LIAEDFDVGRKPRAGVLISPRECFKITPSLNPQASGVLRSGAAKMTSHN